MTKIHSEINKKLIQMQTFDQNFWAKNKPKNNYRKQVLTLGMFITDSLLISNRFWIKCVDSSISIPTFDSLFTYDKMLVLVTKNFIKIKSSQKTQ